MQDGNAAYLAMAIVNWVGMWPKYIVYIYLVIGAETFEQLFSINTTDVASISVVLE